MRGTVGDGGSVGPQSVAATLLQAGDAAADPFPTWAQFPGWQVVTIAVALAVGVYVSKLLVRLLGRPIARRFHRESVAQTILRVIRVFTVLFAVAIGLNIVGFELSDIALSVTVFSAVVGIVLAPIVGSVINGLFILADQPYEIGDMIELDDGTRGFVEDITLRYTKVFTLDNTFRVISNDSIRERDVTNLSAEDERTRLSLQVLVTYECDVDQARRLMERAAKDCDLVLEGGPDIRIGSARYPAKPTCYLDSFADHGILLTLRYWAQRPYKLTTVRSQVQTRLWDLAKDADVEMAYPHQHLVFDETSGTAQVDVDTGGSAPRWGAVDADEGPT